MDLAFFKNFVLPTAFDPQDILEVNTASSRLTSDSRSSASIMAAIHDGLSFGFAAISSDIAEVKKTLFDQQVEIEKLKSSAPAKDTSDPIVVIHHVKGGGCCFW